MPIKVIKVTDVWSWLKQDGDSVKQSRLFNFNNQALSTEIPPRLMRHAPLSGRTPLPASCEIAATCRQKYQRPEVYATGKREKLWKVEYREYFLDADGKERSGTGRRLGGGRTTRKEAQALCDQMLREMRQGGPKADGGMTLAEFWRTVYEPIRSRKWTGHTPKLIAGLWRNHIEPELGTIPLKDII
jgi:hypothetical protein